MSATTLLRCVALGNATGMRGTWGLVGPVLTGTAPGLAKLAAVAVLAGETYSDKQPSVPDRLSTAGLTSRVVTGATGAFLLARRHHVAPMLPVVMGMSGAITGAVAGSRWRRWAVKRMPDWQAGLLEDAVAAPVALAACRSGSSG